MAMTLTITLTVTLTVSSNLTRMVHVETIAMAALSYGGGGIASFFIVLLLIRASFYVFLV